MKNSKYDRTKINELNSNSTLFLQLGMLLALVLVYVTFEIKFSHKIFQLTDNAVLTEEPDVFVFPPFEIQTTKNDKEKAKPKLPELLNVISITDTKEQSSEDFIKKESYKPANYDSIFSEVPIIEEIIKDDISSFTEVEQAPRYPGCKGPSELAFKKCFNEKIKNFVAKKFNPDTDLNLSGKQRIHVQFEIDKNGHIVHIKAKAAHKRLAKEAVNTINKLPKMKPAKQNNRYVGVKYNLPISIYIE